MGRASRCAPQALDLRRVSEIAIGKVRPYLMRRRSDECQVGRIIDLDAVARKNGEQIEPLLFEDFLALHVHLSLALLRPVCENEG